MLEIEYELTLDDELDTFFTTQEFKLFNLRAQLPFYFMFSVLKFSLFELLRVDFL